MSQKDKYMQFKCEPELRERIVEEAKAEGRTMSNLIRWILIKYFSGLRR
jgi:predicted DNA-binding protein